VLSLPPIINSEATKITLNTKNVFVEITGTDLQKIKVSLAIIGAQFSEYCDGDNKFHIEPVEIKYEGDEARNETTPQLKYHEFNVEIDRLNKLLGVTLDKPKIAECAKKMGLNLLSADDKTV
jgi:phenylalanyl-tRNA synthetase beta chain